MRYLCIMSNFAQNNKGKTYISLFPSWRRNICHPPSAKTSLPRPRLGIAVPLIPRMWNHNVG
jgi:hypothetical protein